MRFHRWVQWVLDAQLARAGEPLALLGDVPIGSDPDGADAWMWQDVLATGVTVGAPPDRLGPAGQDWTLPAFVPWKLRAAGYQPFIDTLRAAFRHVGGVRIDHVLGLFRLFWIPEGGTPADGAYVRMPTRELLDILALESQRAGAFVVGEDLGTVEGGVREELLARRILRYQVWWFEDDPVERWATDALGSVTTHDLPTVAGVWTGADLRMQEDAGLDPDTDWLARLHRDLEEATGVAADGDARDVSLALHRRLAAGPSRVVVDPARGRARCRRPAQRPRHDPGPARELVARPPGHARRDRGRPDGPGDRRGPPPHPGSRFVGEHPHWENVSLRTSWGRGGQLAAVPSSRISASCSRARSGRRSSPSPAPASSASSTIARA